MSEELLRVEAISKAFGGVQVLQDVSLSLKGGEVLALVGANGAGKSTLIKVICGAHAADKGTISSMASSRTTRRCAKPSPPASRSLISTT